MGVEPTGDGIARHPPVLKTGTITGPHALPLSCESYVIWSDDFRLGDGEHCIGNPMRLATQSAASFVDSAR